MKTGQVRPLCHPDNSHTTCELLHLSEQRTSRIYCSNRHDNWSYQLGRDDVFSGEFLHFIART